MHGNSKTIRNVSLNDNLTAKKDFATEIAKQAGSMIRADFKIGCKTKLKEDDTPVTDTDKRINALVIEEVKKRFPREDVLSEEGSYIKNRNGNIWVCDPLDGTRVFSHGIPTSVFSLAFLRDGRPQVGVVYDPFNDRIFSAEIGKGAFLNGEEIRVSGDKKLRNTTIGISSFKGAQFNLVPLIDKLLSKEVWANVLQLGSITYQGAMVSCGEFSASVHPARMSWDSAALKVIVEEAGGKVTNLFGAEQRYDGKIKGCVFSNGKVHDQIVDFIKMIRK